MLIARLSRIPVLCAVLLLAGAVLAGCGSGPRQAGSAVIVGDQAVPLAEVQRRVDAVLTNPEVMRDVKAQGGTPADVARFLATSEVQHLLLAESARRENITVTDQQVDRELANPATAQRLEASLVFDPADAREAVRDQLIARQLAERYLDRLTVTVDIVVAESKADALAKARQLAAGPAEADALLRAEGRNAQRDLRLRASLVPRQAALFLFGTPAGRVIAAQTSESPESWTVLRVTEREAPPAPPGTGSGSVAQLDAQTIDDIGRRLTQPLAEELGVRVNPRYGTWDPMFLAVVPPGQQSSIVLPAALD